MSAFMFRSTFAGQIKEFIRQKLDAGYLYKSGMRALREFDEFLADQHPRSKVITKEICDGWLSLVQEKSVKTIRMKITPVRQLAEYMNTGGKPHYIIPTGLLPKEKRYDAHIYTDPELIAIFAAIDQTPLNCHSPTRKYVDPVLFRMLYCCGMRIGEAISLTINDVDLNTGKISIKESKLWKSRNVYMPNDLLEVCVEYDHLINLVVRNRIAFFPNLSGKALSASSYEVFFRKIINNLPIFQDYTGNVPRIHDLRHTFITKRLNQWVRENEDIRVLFPYLSEYVGHSSAISTDYYLSLVDEFYPQINQLMRSTNSRILPEVAYEKCW